MIDLKNASRDDLIRLTVSQHETIARQQVVRHRMEPTARVVHVVDTCPTCGMLLVGGSVKRTREVIEAPLAPAIVTEHVFLERCCPHFRTRHTPAGDLGAAAVGTQRFGVGLVSLIATLRAEARLPVATIQWYLATVHQLHISVGAIAGAIQQVAGTAAGTMRQMGRLVTDAAITVSGAVYENCRVTTLNLPVVPSAVANCTTGPCRAVSVTAPCTPDVG